MQNKKERAAKKKERAIKKKMGTAMTTLEPCDNSLSSTRIPREARRTETNLEGILREESAELL